MPTWTNEQLRDYEARRKPKTSGEASSAQPEPPICHDPLGPTPGKETHPGRYLVIVTSYRCALLDADNLAGGVKYFVDALRYVGAIPDDRPEDIELQTRQVKVKTRAEERTEVEVSLI